MKGEKASQRRQRDRSAAIDDDAKPHARRSAHLQDDDDDTRQPTVPCHDKKATNVVEKGLLTVFESSATAKTSNKKKQTTSKLRLAEGRPLFVERPAETRTVKGSKLSLAEGRPYSRQEMGQAPEMTTETVTSDEIPQEPDYHQQPGAVHVPGIDANGNEGVSVTEQNNSNEFLTSEQPSAAETSPPLLLSAHTVDTEQENRVVEERDALRQMVDNAVVANIVVGDDERKSKRKRQIMLVIIALVAIIIAVVAVVLVFLLGDGNSSSVNSNKVEDPSASPEPTPAPTNACTNCWLQSGQTIVGVEGSRSGAALALSADGTTLVIGEPGIDQARAFHWNEEEQYWNQLGSAIEGPIGSGFGAAVAVSRDGRTVAVGGPEWTDTSGLESVGIVQVYRWVLPHQTWQLLHESEGIVSTHYGGSFGKDVALSASGRTLIVTEPWSDPHVEAWVSIDGDLDDLQPWHQLAYWSPFASESLPLSSYMWPDIVAVSADGSTVLAADSSSAVVVKLNYTSDWTVVGRQINGSFAVMSEDATVLAVGKSFEDTMPEDIETTVYRWNEGIANWTQWGNTTLRGYPMALAFDGSIVATLTVKAILRVYQYQNDTWLQLGEDLTAMEPELPYVAASKSIVSGSSSSGISLAFATASTESTEGGTTVYTFHDPSGYSVPTKPPRVFLECETGYTSFRLELTTDLMPDDQTWTLEKDGSGDPILSGGPYSEALTTFVYEDCLLSTDCYQLRIVDSYQEGLCCVYGEGGYVLFLDGNVSATTLPYSDIAYGVYSHWFGECTF